MARRTGDDPTKKTDFQIRRSVLQAVRVAVEEGAAVSQNAFVERALVRELRELRRCNLYEAYAEAAHDPAFREDMSSTSNAFDATVRDGLDEA